MTACAAPARHVPTGWHRRGQEAVGRCATALCDEGGGQEWGAGGQEGVNAGSRIEDASKGRMSLLVNRLFRRADTCARLAGWPAAIGTPQVLLAPGVWQSQQLHSSKEHELHTAVQKVRSNRNTQRFRFHSNKSQNNTCGPSSHPIVMGSCNAATFCPRPRCCCSPPGSQGHRDPSSVMPRTAPGVRGQPLAGCAGVAYLHNGPWRCRWAQAGDICFGGWCRPVGAHPPIPTPSWSPCFHLRHPGIPEEPGVNSQPASSTSSQQQRPGQRPWA